MTYYMSSGDLLSKWGFKDGDLFTDFVCDKNQDADSHEFLYYVVQKKLVPKLDELGISRYISFNDSTIHNPVLSSHLNGKTYNFRAMYDSKDHKDFVSVEISEEEVENLLTEFIGGQPGTIEVKEAEARIIHKIAIAWTCPDCKTQIWDDPKNVVDGNMQCACSGLFYRLVLNKKG